MLLANVFTKTTRDRWLGITIGVVAVSLWMLAAMAIYRDIDLSLYTEMPESIRTLMNIPADAEVGSLAYGVLFGFAGAIALASLALSMGAASIAGEERDGTIGLLLGNPKSRTRVLVAKAGSMVLLIGLATLGLWVAAEISPLLLDVDTSGIRLGAMMLHLFANAMFYGFLAMLIGGWTGNRARASGLTVGVMVLSYFAVGLLPLVDSVADVARIFPWYYFDSSNPLSNGINTGHVGLLFGFSALFAVGAIVGVNRRDLRGQSVGITMLDRLRSYPLTNKLVERLAGSARVSHIWLKTLSEHQGLLIITGYVMFLSVGVLLGPMYAAVDEALVDFAENLPEALMALVGNADITTPEGWFQTETFSFMGPFAVILVAAIIGARGIAGEEANRTMGLLLANPIKRSKIVLETSVAMIAAAVVVGVFTFAGVATGSLISGLGMSIVNIGATSLLMTLLGLVFGALTLALSGGLGRVKPAIYGTVGVSVTFFLANAYLPLNDSLAGYAKWSPFYYFLSSDPLVNGMNWGHGLLLAGLTVALIGAAVVLFDRRDIRQNG